MMTMVTLMEAYPKDESGLISPVFSQEAKVHDPVRTDADQQLEVSVVFTDDSGTQAALNMAEALGRTLGARIHLVLPYEVPYTLPLAKPAVPAKFLEEQARTLALKTHLDVTAQVCLCRDKKAALVQLLKPGSVVVVGGKRRWWPTAAQKLARDLRKDGHEVIFAELR